jgi:predicted phage terminase large subunit-like protein
MLASQYLEAAVSSGLSLDFIEREIARRKHYNFIKHLWVGSDQFIDGRHIRIICDRIDKAIEDFRQGISTFLVIKVPFRHSKSTIVSRYLPPNFIGKFPDKEVMVATYSASLCRTFSRFSRNIMRSEEYQWLFPDVQLSSEEQSVDVWGIEGRQGKVHWLGIGGSITGKGGSLIIIDDFFKGREEAASELVRGKVWDSIINELLTRRADPCISIILATPWHLDDPFGRIKEQMRLSSSFPQFEELVFPAKSEAYPTGYLWPEKFGAEWYESQFATLGPYYAAALLQCDPTPRSGNMFRVDKLKFYKSPPDDVQWTRGWDLASSEKSRTSSDPDYTVGIRLGVRWIASGVEGQAIPILYVDDLVRGRWEALQRKNIIRDNAIGDGDINLGVESFGGFKDAYTEMSQILAGLRIVKKLHMPGDKVSKWAPLEAAFAAGNVYLREAPWNQDFIQEFSVAPDGKHDDIVDALSVAFALHNPGIKQVWPSFAAIHTIKMEIQWDQVGPYSTAHVGALSLQKDLSLNYLGGLWDDKLQKLYVYGCLSWASCNQTDVVEKLVAAMKLDKFRLDKLIGSENMFSQNAWEHSVARQINRQIKDKNLPEAVTVREPLHFNFYGAIQQGEELFRQNSILLNNDLVDVHRQWRSWVISKGKPATEDCGYCEALCLIIAELNRKKKITIAEPKQKDYIKIV